MQHHQHCHAEAAADTNIDEEMTACKHQVCHRRRAHVLYQPPPTPATVPVIAESLHDQHQHQHQSSLQSVDQPASGITGAYLLLHGAPATSNVSMLNNYPTIYSKTSSPTDYKPAPDNNCY